MLHDILFTIPEKYAFALANDEVRRFGALLKETATGKIVAHVQETGLGQSLFSIGQGLPFSPLGVVNSASSIYGNIQLNQVKGAVDGLGRMMQDLQLLQYANIGVAATGIGVSVLGFAYLAKKMKGLESAIDSSSRKMDKHFQELYEREIRRKFAEIYVLFEQLERLPHCSNLDYKRMYSNSIEQGLHSASGFLRSEIAHHWDQNKFDLNWFNTLVSCLLVCDSSRIQCLLISNEMSAAKHDSAKIAGHYCDLFDLIGPAKLSEKLLVNIDEQEFDYKKIEADAFKVADGLNEITNASLSKVLLIEHLIDKGVSGNQFISEMNANTQHPIVLLEA